MSGSSGSIELDILLALLVMCDGIVTLLLSNGLFNVQNFVEDRYHDLQNRFGNLQKLIPVPRGRIRIPTIPSESVEEIFMTSLGQSDTDNGEAGNESSAPGDTPSQVIELQEVSSSGPTQNDSNLPSNSPDQPAVDQTQDQNMTQGHTDRPNPKLKKLSKHWWISSRKRLTRSWRDFLVVVKMVIVVMILIGVVVSRILRALAK
ncbi:hypothetical protein K504DRAFT_450427 [Pleomassaria siparia CBS 279.74]|uniref:Uncharacterized protein n=1 Tax=Pleomassaria siparia CBS 279.74 TaxID=1314801 RepID=A0A6G1KN10_9PLEO|nr:hypothetical protein K504DRAFT_450427 [Pleomassaria siparia CBS 279.74]